jgi:hypothetical protein
VTKLKHWSRPSKEGGVVRQHNQQKRCYIQLWNYIIHKIPLNRCEIWWWPLLAETCSFIIEYNIFFASCVVWLHHPPYLLLVHMSQNTVQSGWVVLELMLNSHSSFVGSRWPLRRTCPTLTQTKRVSFLLRREVCKFKTLTEFLLCCFPAVLCTVSLINNHFLLTFLTWH